MKILTVLALSLSAFVSVNASAELIKDDWLEANDNRSLYDTETKLTWLTLNETFGKSFSAMKSDLLTDEKYKGFRYATKEEVLALLQPVMGFSAPDTTPDTGAWTNVGDASTDWFRSLFHSNNDINSNSGYSSTIYGMFEGGNGEESDGITHFGVNTGSNARWYDYPNNFEGNTWPTIGHFLVADGAQGIFLDKNPNLAADVPVSFGVGAMSLLAFGFASRKRAGKNRVLS